MRFVVFFLVAGCLFVLFFWVIFLKGVSVDVVLESSAITSDGDDFLVQEYDISDDGFEVVFDGIDVMRFLKGSEFELQEISEENGFYTVSLGFSNGSVWVSNMGGVLDLQIESGDFMFQNVDGYYFLEKSGDNLYAYAYKHPLRVYFLDGEGNSLNSYLVPEGYYVSLVEGEVTSVVSDLRYAKLVKEYPFYSLSEDEFEEEWIAWAEEDSVRYKSLLNDFEVVVRQSYNDGGQEEGFVYDVLAFLREKLTFSNGKKEEWAEQYTLKYLNASLYLSVKGDADGAISKLQSLEHGSVVGEEYTDYLSFLNVVLNNSLYGGDLYAVKVYLRDLLYGDSEEGQVVVLRERLNEMYDLVGQGEIALAKEAFSDYERGWLTFFGTSDLSDFRKDISEERELLSVLLLSEDGFYDVDYFDLLDEFEAAIFKIAISGVDLDEERQSFVANKVKVVNKLEELLASSSIDIDDATDLLIMLLDDAEVLMDDIGSEAAVLEYYEQKIEEGWLVTQFINSVEYSSLGGSFDEKFEEYLKKEQDVEELKEYLQSLHLGADDEGDLTLSEAKALVYDDLDAAGVSYSAIVSVGDGSYRLFEIQGGEVAGVSFEAKYDREGKLIYDLEAEGVSFSTGMHVDSLAEVVGGLQMVDGSGELADSSGELVGGSLQVADWSYSEELAISMLIDYLNGFGIKVSESNVVSLDVDEDLFYLEGVEIDGKQVDFTVWAGEDVVTGVVVDGEKIDGEFEVDEFVIE